jgi:hypothetical protein
MAAIECIICENCRNLVYSEDIKAKECPHCNSIYTGKEIGIPIMGEIHLESRTPKRVEIDLLKNTKFKRKKLSLGEMKLGIILILCGIIITPIAIFFGIYVFANYIFRNWGIIVFGCVAFLVAIGAIVGFFAGVGILLRNPRKKSLIKVFNWVWNESYGEIFQATDSKNEYKNAYGSVIRCVPNKISDTLNKESLKEYLLKIKNYCRAFLDEKSMETNLSCKLQLKSEPLIMDKWTSVWVLSNVIIENENNLESGVKEATGSFIITKVLSCTKGNYNCKLNVASLSVKIHSYYIQSGKYWFPYDLMPEIKE